MKRPVYVYTAVTGLLLIASACTDIVIMPNHTANLPTGCKTQPIGQNIVGTWHVESTINPKKPNQKGTITFTADKAIDDPDALFETSILGKPVVAKTYDPSVPFQDADAPKNVFMIYLSVQQSGQYAQITPFTVLRNECNYIQLVLTSSTYQNLGLILTRQ